MLFFSLKFYVLKHLLGCYYHYSRFFLSTVSTLPLQVPTMQLSIQFFTFIDITNLINSLVDNYSPEASLNNLIKCEDNENRFSTIIIPFGLVAKHRLLTIPNNICFFSNRITVYNIHILLVHVGFHRVIFFPLYYLNSHIVSVCRDVYLFRQLPVIGVILTGRQYEV